MKKIKRIMVILALILLINIPVYGALQNFNDSNIDKIILDLRDNQGGLLDQAIEISNLFIESGDIVHIQDNNEIIQTVKAYAKELEYELVVLVNDI